MHSIDEQLAAYHRAITVDASETDAVTVQRYMIERDALLVARNEAVNAITQKQQQYALNEKQTIANQVQEASAYFQREIPGWTPERDNQVAKFAVDSGIPMQTLSAVILKNPQFAKLIHKAELYDQLEKKQSAKPKTPVAPPAPVTRIGASRATANKDPEKMSMDEWAKWRNEQRRKR